MSRTTAPPPGAERHGHAELRAGGGPAGTRRRALAPALLLATAVGLTVSSIGLQRRQALYLVTAALAGVAVVALIAFVRLANASPDLRRLRFLAVLLPSVFILSTMVALYFVEIDEQVSEVGEHIFATVIISAGAIPFSVYVFRAFTRLRDELAHRAAHLQALHATSMAVTGEPSPPVLYRRIASGARDLAGADRGAILLRPEGSERELVEVAPQDARPDAWETALLTEVGERGALKQSSDGSRTLLAVPIPRHDRVIGAMAAIRRGTAPFSVEDELMLGMFAVAAAAALENAARLEEAQLLATVEERERIARDLHDDLGQLLGFLTTKIQATQQLVATGRGNLAEQELARLEEATRTLGAQVREAILGLRARIGPDRPLSRALEEYVSEFGIQAEISTEFAAQPGAGLGLPGSAQFQLLRIAQEALSNARRHSRARRVSVGLTEDDGCLELVVADDGTGFDTASPGAGFGLKTMRERVEALDGTFGLRSGPGVGTTVSVRVPLDGG